MSNIEEKLKELNIVLPEAPKPVGLYKPTIKAGLLVFTSGILPLDKNGNLMFTQQIDSSNISEGQEAALCALKNALSILKRDYETLNNIDRIIRLAGYINSQPGFCEQAEVMNPTSKLLNDIWGEKGQHVRTAIGVNELPLGASVEIELMVQVKNI